MLRVELRFVVVLCLHGTTLSYFMLLWVMHFRHGRHIGLCRYDTVNIFFGPSTAHDNVGMSSGYAGPSTTLKISLLVLFFCS